MKPIRVLVAASEAAPFAKVGGLADVTGSLPVALNRNFCDARVIIPLYRPIKQKYTENMKFMGWRMIKMGWRSLYAGLYTMEYEGVRYYFVDNEYYFNFEQVYVEYSFDIERFCFFQRAVLEFMGEFMDFEPDILHCNDWQTGMMPLLLDAHYKSNHIHNDVKTVYTIHNLKYQGVHGIELVRDLLDLPDMYISDDLSTQDGAMNFMKAGIVYSHSITTVSPTYAYEIMTDYYGEGLNGILQKYAYKIKGILNGLDVKEYDPSTDLYLKANYTSANFSAGKKENKRYAQKKFELFENEGAPLCVMISRLVDQKGLDLLLHVLDEMLFDGMQVIVLGTGDLQYETRLAEIEKRNKGKMSAYIGYDNEIAHLLYAAADIFLMPSLFEPCGLSQMISMRYGALPVARETGGLKDTVEPYNEYEDTGVGFAFANINAHEFLFVTKYACDVYRNHRKKWDLMVKRAMDGNYGWDQSAKEYVGLYSFIAGISLQEDLNGKSSAAKKPPARAAAADKPKAPKRGKSQDKK